LRDFAFLDALANLRAADHDSASGNRRYLDHFEFVMPLFQGCNCARLPVPESKVASNTQGLGAQPVHHVAPDEGIWSSCSERHVEFCNEKELDSRAFEKTNLLRKRADQSWRDIRREYADGMGRKSEDRRADPQASRSFDDLPENRLMSEVKAIEVADAYHGRFVQRCIGQIGNDFHRGMIIRNDRGKVRKAR
jgi:hypothetical protein